MIRHGDWWIPGLERISYMIDHNSDLTDIERRLETAYNRYPSEKLEITVIQAETYMRAQQLEKAYGLLSQALHSNPDDHMLLYTRSLVSERLGDMASVESDLRQILSTERLEEEDSPDDLVNRSQDGHDRPRDKEPAQSQKSQNPPTKRRRK